jgi:hypothetical protein
MEVGVLLAWRIHHFYKREKIVKVHENPICIYQWRKFVSVGVGCCNDSGLLRTAEANFLLIPAHPPKNLSE